MANFDDAIHYVLVNECGPALSDVVKPDNDGGLVKFGLNAKANPDLLTLYGSKLERMTLESAKWEYRKRYWLSVWDGLNSQRVATKCLDMNVNLPFPDSVKHMQAAVGGEQSGFFGPRTLALMNAIPEDPMLQALVAQCVLHYDGTIQAKPQYAKYRTNWMNRAKKLP